MNRRLPLIAAVGAVLLLTACGPATPPTPTPTASGVAAPTPTATASASPTPSPTPSPSATAASTYPTGTCTQADMLSYSPTPTIYTIYQFGASSPVTFKYMGFNRDGTNPIFTGTTTAMVTTIIAWPCTVVAGEQLWKFTATVPHSSASLGCVLAYGGNLVHTDSKGGDDTQPWHVSCTGNPGV